jgi:hypothetical protein
MASKKRKRPTALFEVITKSRQYHRAKPPSQPRVGVLALVRRWLKRVPGSSAEPAVATGTAAHRIAALEVSRLDLPPVEAEHSHDATEEAAIVAAAPVESQVDVCVHESHEIEAAEPAPEYPDLLAGEPPQNLAVAVDPERRQISLRMSYTVAIVAGFAVVVIVALSIIVGQHLNRSGVPLLAQTTTDELRKQPPHREVLDPIRHINGGAAAANTDRTDVPQARSLAASATADGPQAAPPASPLPSIASDGKRLIGVNYVIIQGYPESERKMAEEAAAFLNKEGVSCTVETGVKGYMALTVVGLQGFDKQSSPTMKAYLERIKQLSNKYAANNRSFKAFAPTAKKWDKQD